MSYAPVKQAAMLMESSRSKQTTMAHYNYGAREGLYHVVYMLVGKNQKHKAVRIMEERLINIEMKISSQEDMLDSLNQIVYQQQKKIDHLEAMITALAKHLKQVQEAGRELDSRHEKPPHY